MVGAGGHGGPPRPSRRAFLAAAALGLSAVVAGCAPAPLGRRTGKPERPESLLSRPSEPTQPFPGAGTHPLQVTADRDALLHIPPLLEAGRAAPLVITLHGAGGDSEAGLGLLRAQADERGILLLAAASRESTWDAVGRGRYGTDVQLLDEALKRTFDVVGVDEERIAVAGFSDGASYALGLGLANGGLLRRIAAFSPGFIPPGGRDGSPSVFLTHGTADEVLPIDRTSRRIVSSLRDEGLDVDYREFPGGHWVPPELAEAAVDWLDRDGSAG
ncbi:alpha/beta hydrolase [Naasia sp. SYSU D00057]|uniref:alpha/beta hydrolase n=1 Tax=Naasia sp. SYSU D00057 TaxID=2817380 RepID=UPI001B311018|nr:hypothetical protein [Naasia sp. SYSU D00057]